MKSVIKQERSRIARPRGHHRVHLQRVAILDQAPLATERILIPDQWSIKVSDLPVQVRHSKCLQVFFVS